MRDRLVVRPVGIVRVIGFVMGVVIGGLLLMLVWSVPGEDRTSSVVRVASSPTPSASEDFVGTPLAGPLALNDVEPVTDVDVPTADDPLVPVVSSPGWVDPASSGQPWGLVKGLLTFRGNPTRTYYGSGPVPRDPQIVWRFPEGGPMCSESSVGYGESKQTKLWCGSGWTGQPAVFERDGETWVIVGSFGRNVHFLDADTGKPRLPDFETGDIVKGSVTVDPDGYPLVYTGSRDGEYRVISFDADEPEELWSLNAYDVAPVRWNDDWDGAGLVLNDYLFIGGENSQLHIVRLNRGHTPDGLVTVNPELVFNAPGWDDELIEAVGGNVSIESSVTVSGDVVYFANSGGLVQGWNIAGLTDGEQPERVFRFWTGDDTDATLVADTEGMLYAAVQYERGTQRSHEVGQILKLDPSLDNPLVWSVSARGDDTVPPGVAPSRATGVWATPGLHRDILIVPTDYGGHGEALGIDTATGEVRWSVKLLAPTWSSPVIVDEVWIQGDCSGRLSAFDVSDTQVRPPELWQINLGGCIESTPAMWDGLLTVGTKQGWIYGIR